jgi:hypothetical protein
MQHNKTNEIYTVAVNFKKGSLRKLLQGGNYLSNYGIAQLYTDGIAAGIYRLYLVNQKSGKNKLYRLAQIHEIRR